MDTESAISSLSELSPSDGESENSEGRTNRFKRQRRNARSPPEVSPDGKKWRNRSPLSQYYDSEGEAMQRLKERLPSDQQNLYTYVPISDDEIMLVLLSPGKEDDKIYCELKAIRISKIKYKKIRYQALSYCWGSEHPTEAIFIQDISVPQATGEAEEMMILMATQTKPRPFAVRPNLFAALKCLRSETDDVWLWVDAICINQEDDDEKNHQLPKMPDIYRRAWKCNDMDRCL
jgi:Heterokaryon incompatibility protein (HET)